MLTLHTVQENDPRLPEIRALFREYNDFLGFDLCFQGFEEELAALPGKYAAPSGRLYLALWNGEVAGCGAFYRFADGICEFKRLYVRPEFKGHGIGRAIMEQAIQDATLAGYHVMRLDSLRRLEEAGKLYITLGFREIAPYNHNPFDDVYYMERALQSSL